MIDTTMRDEVLLRMGFRSFGHYLASPLWRRIKSRVFTRYHGKCVVCGNKANQTHFARHHHEVFVGHRLGQIKLLCRPCREAGEWSPDNRLMDVEEFNERLELFKAPTGREKIRRKRRRKRRRIAA